MRYINPYYPWFTSVGTVKNSGKDKGYINTNDWVVKYIEEDTGTCVKMAFDVSFSSYFNGISVCGLNYRKVNGTSTPNVSVYVNNNYYLELKVSDKTVYTTSFLISANVWYHIYMEADTANGKVVVYVDGNKIVDYGAYVTTGALLEYFRLYMNSSYIKMKNIIVTDGALALDETVMEIDATVEYSEWDSTDSGYSTSEIGKSIVVKPEKTSVDGYAITGTTIMWESALGSDNVPAVAMSLGGKSNRVELPRSNSHCIGTCFEGIAPGNITVTSAE